MKFDIKSIKGGLNNGYVQSKVIKSVKCDVLLLLGERACGKSFAVKETIIKDAYNNDIQFALIRRYTEDVKDYLINEYFDDCILNKNGRQYIKEWTKGEYTTVTAYQKSIYFANYDEEKGRLIKGKKIGRMFGLSGAEHYKSLAFPNMKNLVYEEFITDGYYLPNEPKKLLNLVSTILRHDTGKLYCVGNKVSRVCPYFGEWGLVNIPKQEIDTIDIYKLTDEDGQETKIGVYMCNTMNTKSAMFFGNAKKQISKGEWETDEQPHIKGHRDDYKSIYNVVMVYDKSMFLCEFLQSLIEPNNFTWYITPKTTEIQNNTRVVSNKYDINPLYTCGFVPLNNNEAMIFNMLKQGKVCYCDNLTGTEFLQCYKLMKII